MMHEDWSRLRTLFDEALERPAAEREAIVSSLGSDRMAHELRELLAAHDGSGPFDRLMDEIRGSGVEQLLHLEPGDELGPYRVVREIGRGGMAVVYEAFDVRHERQVAVKVLRPELAALIGADRFVHEMRTTAKLQHPHIIPLFDSGEADGYLFYVMPYVEGESLREKLNREGRLGLEEAIRITTDVADALDYAHRHGVIHRDIKPGNVLLYEGRPMVSDFGIALAMSVTVDGRAGAGVPLGTPDYMSPEQAEGRREITHRSDIYSLGCMLYEMLAGSRPYGGESPRVVSEQHAAEPVPDIRTVRASVPGPVSRAIATAMAKEPSDRYETAGELAQAIQPPEEISAQFRRRYGLFFRRDVRWLVNVAAAVAFLLAGVWLTAEFTGGEGGGAEPAALGMRARQLTDDEPTLLQMTHGGTVRVAVISPSGEHLASAREEPGGGIRISVSEIGAARPERTLALVEGLVDMTWLPDDSGVAFMGTHMGQYGWYSVARAGGTVTPLGWRHGRQARVSPDGSECLGFYWDYPYLNVDTLCFNRGNTPWSEGVDAIPVAGSYEYLADAAYSPRGDYFVVSTWSESGIPSIRAVSRSGDDQRPVVEGDIRTDFLSLYWRAGGRVLYYSRAVASGSELMRLATSPKGEPEGEPETLLRLGDSLAVHGVSADSRRLSLVKTLKKRRIVRLWADPEGGLRVEPVRGAEEAGDQLFRVSPGGEWLAFLVKGATGKDIYRVPVEGGTPERLTRSGRVRSFSWSPDGKFLAFTAPLRDTVRVWLASATSGALRQLRGAVASPGGEVWWAPGPLMYQMPGMRNFWIVDSLSIRTRDGLVPLTLANLDRWGIRPLGAEPEYAGIEGVGRPLVSNDSVGRMCCPTTSPDGRWVAVRWPRSSPGPGMWRIALTDSVQTLIIPDTQTRFHHPVAWTADGTGVYAQVGNWTEYSQGRLGREFLLIPVDGSEPETVLTLPEGPKYVCDPLGSGAEMSWICSETTVESDAWLIENFDPQAD